MKRHTPITVPDSIETMGSDEVDEAIIRDAMSRIGTHAPERLNIVAHAVTDVLGFTAFSRRYAIAVLVLERLSSDAGMSSTTYPEETQ